MNCRSLVQSLNTTGRRYIAAKGKPPKKGRKAPAPTKAQCKPKKEVCRYVYPYPKNIDLFTLRPEPYCITPECKCDRGKWPVFIAGLLFMAISAYISITIPIHMMWYNFEEEDEDE